MELNCRRCGEPIPAGNINVQETIAVCPNCNAVFNFGGQALGEDDPYGDVEKPKRKQKRSTYRADQVAMPDRFSMESDEETLHISYQWFGLQTVITTLFTVVWVVMLFSVFGFGFGFGGFFGFGFGFGFAGMFPLLFGGATLALIYHVLSKWLNRTHVIVTPDTLRVFSQPLPTWNNKTLRSEDIQQLYVRQHFTRSNNGRIHTTYQVRAMMHTGKDEFVVGSLESPMQALFVEQQVEDFLGIEHREIFGSWR